MIEFFSVLDAIPGQRPSHGGFCGLIGADAEFLQVAALYRGRPDFDVAALVAELVEAEAVPLLPILRYTPAGLRKREVWERTWDLQREEDRLTTTNDTNDTNEESDIRAIRVIRGCIPVPPKYASTDFLKTDYWRLRGKLDVPREPPNKALGGGGVELG